LIAGKGNDRNDNDEEPERLNMDIETIRIETAKCIMSFGPTTIRDFHGPAYTSHRRIVLWHVIGGSSYAIPGIADSAWTIFRQKVLALYGIGKNDACEADRDARVMKEIYRYARMELDENGVYAVVK